MKNITVGHLVVGVDIAQETHVARAVNFRGIALGSPLEFSNNEVGFQSFHRWIRDLLVYYRLHTSIIGMEPTGHYWLSFAKWLECNLLEAVLVNPHLVKKNKENRDNTPSKSDKKDALVIADMVKNGYYSPVRFHREEFEELRVLMANRETVVKRLVSAVNQILRWVDIIFPELRQVFKILTCTSASDIMKLSTEDVIAGWKQYVKRHSGVRRAQLLIDLAKRTVGIQHATKAFRLHLSHLLEEYDLSQTQLQRIDEAVTSVLKRIPFAAKLLAIKGISATSLAGVLANLGTLAAIRMVMRSYVMLV